jgi:Zn-finger nucleic acid-binding protein
MFCSACGAAIDATDKHNPHRCAHCGVPCADEEDDGITVVGAHVGLICPLCRVALVSAVIEQENVCYCGTCHGFLADTETFSVIVAKRRALHWPHEKVTSPIDPAELERQVACPKCHERMDTHPYYGGGNVVVDTCERCSLIWLDDGELAVIERYVPYVHQIERTLTLRGGRFQGGPDDMPVL